MMALASPPTYAEAERIALAVVQKWARRLQLPPSVGLADLEQWARLGALKALRTYDPARGAHFSTWVGALALGEARRGLRDGGRGHLSRVRWGEISAGAERRPEDHAPRSLDERIVHADGESPLAELVADPRAEFADRTVARLDLERAFGRLPQRYREVLRRRYLDGQSQSQIARELGASQMTICRWLGQALLALDTALHSPLSPPGSPASGIPPEGSDGQSRPAVAKRGATSRR